MILNWLDAMLAVCRSPLLEVICAYQQRVFNSQCISLQLYFDSNINVAWSGGNKTLEHILRSYNIDGDSKMGDWTQWMP